MRLILFFLMMLITNVFSANIERCNSMIIGGLSGGFKTADYNEINKQLKEYHGLNGINLLPTIGIQGTIIKHRVVISSSLLAGYKHMQKSEAVFQKSLAKVGFSGLTANLKCGMVPFQSNKNIFYPYLGLDLEYLRMKMNTNYKIKSLDCFFQDGNQYTIYNYGIIFGISYNRVTEIIKNGPAKLVIGLNGGMIVAVTDNIWKVNGKKMKNNTGATIPQFDPGGIFLHVYLGFLLSK